MTNIPQAHIPLSGALTPEGHILTQRVYYEDTDFSGVVYHARYLHFMERGRTDFLRCFGVEQAKLHMSEGEGMAFVVHRMEIDFKSSARMDDVLTILTRSEKAAGAKLVLAQEVRLGDRPLISALVTVAVVNRAGRPRRLPAELAAKFDQRNISGK
jgi:acyl-CoA thioester hydrolase